MAETLCSQSRGPGSIPGQGSRSHLPQLRVHMPQLQIPQAGIKRILHATTKIEGPACHSWGPVKANKYILKKKKNKKKEREMSGLDLKDVGSYLGQHWV